MLMLMLLMLMLVLLMLMLLMLKLMRTALCFGSTKRHGSCLVLRFVLQQKLDTKLLRNMYACLPMNSSLLCQTHRRKTNLNWGRAGLILLR